MGWYIWTAILAAMPYGVFSFGPLIPGQIGTTAFALAVIFFVIVSLLKPYVRESHRDIVARAQVFLPRVGWVATAGLIIVETYAFARGQDGLTTVEQIAFNDAMSLIEFACSAVSVFCWAVSAPEDESQGEELSQVHHIIVGFIVGGLWPTICVFITSSLGLDLSSIAFVLCPVVFLLALQAGAYWRKRGCLTWDVSAVLAGHMSFIAFRGFVNEYRADFLDAGLPSVAFYGFFFVLLTLLSIALLLHVGGDKGNSERKPNASPCDTTSTAEQSGSFKGRIEQRMTQHLMDAALDPLTEREAVVLARTALGATVKSIASDLELAQATVATYRRRGYGRLGVGGAKELRKLAEGFDLSKKPSETEEMSVLSGKGCSMSRHDPLMLRAIALVCVILVLLFDAPNHVQIGEHWYHRGTFYSTWAVSCALAMTSFARMSLSYRRTLIPCVKERSFRVAGTTALSLILACLLSAGAFCGWSGMLLYKVWGPILLIVASLVVGRAYLTRDDAAFSPWRVLLTGFGILFDSPLLALEASAGIAVTYFFGLYFSGLVTDWIFILFPSLIFLGVVALVYQTRVAAVHVIEPPDKELDRALYYLKGRGVDGLRAQVVIDLACGFSAPEVCRRRCTTLATVRSYRQRTYDDFGIHGLSDLRELLFRDAKVTSLGQMHPQK